MANAERGRRGEGHVRHGAEHVKAVAVTRVNRFTQQPGAPVGHVQAMSGITWA